MVLIKVLNVAEKPSVAKEVARILSSGHFSHRRGLSKYNPVYEFSSFKLEGKQVKMIVTSVSGHLMSLEFTSRHRSWTSCSPIELFQAPIVKKVQSESQINIKKTLEREVRGCQILLLWLDCDREGENICFEVIDVCKMTNPNLEVKRAHFSALIPRDIIHACETLTPPNENFSNAVDTRQEIDLRLGAAFTRFQTQRIQRKFSNLSHSVISYGPCQFPTLGFVVDRFIQQRDFIPEEFWYIKCCAKIDEEGGGGRAREIEFHWSRGHLFDHISCLIFYEQCCLNPEAYVISLSQRVTSKRRPFPLQTVSLQKLASQKLHMSAERAMKIAESLYCKGFISYPRTETDSFKKGTDLKSLIQIQTQHSQWGEYSRQLLEDNEFRWPMSGKNDDHAHPPIHPTKSVDNSIKGDDLRLYELITRHFLACCGNDAKGQQTIVIIQIGLEKFKTNGLIITEKHFLEVYHPYQRWQANTLPLFFEGQTFFPSILNMCNSKTSPPSLLTEHDLITLMDQNGIGTDATIAEHISKIQSRNYAEKHGTVFYPTDLGLALVKGYNNIGYDLAKPVLRATMESDLHLVSTGIKSKSEVLNDCLGYMKGVFEHVCRMATLLDNAIAEHFAQIGTSNINSQLINHNISHCGACLDETQSKGLMDLRLENRDSSQCFFLQCTRCGIVCSLPHNTNRFVGIERDCPTCRFQMVEAYYQDNGSRIICPFCFTSMPSSIDGNISNGLNVCTPVRPCVACHQILMLRQTKKGDWFLGCSNYPDCKASMFLPSATETVTVSDKTCDFCGTQLASKNLTDPPPYMLEFVFRPGQIPYYMPQNIIACPFCDQQIRELNESLPIRRSYTQHSTDNRTYKRQATTNRASSNTNVKKSKRSNGEIACYECGDPNHMLPDCPKKNSKKKKRQPSSKKYQTKDIKKRRKRRGGK